MPVDADVLDGPPAPASRLEELRRRVEARLAGTLARGTLWSFALNVAGAAISLGVQVLLAQSLGRETYGLYLYALALMNVGLLVGKFELDTAAVRFVGAYTARGEWPLLRGYLRWSRHFVSTASLGLAAIAALVVWVRRDAISPAAAAAYWAACALLPLTALQQLKASGLQGFKRVPAAQAPGVVLRPLLFAGGVALAAYAFRATPDAAGAVALNLGATVLTLALSAGLLRRAVPAAARDVEPAFEVRLWVHTALGLLAISFAQLVLSSQSDVLIVGSFLTKADAANYGAANQLAVLINFGVTAVLFVAMPMMAELYARGSRPELQRLLTTIGWANAAVSLPVVLGLVAFGKPLLGLFGPAFVSAYPVLLVLSLAQLIVALVGGTAGFLMIMTGHQTAAGVIIGGSAVLNLALTVVLTPRYGAAGTAAATAAATLARSLVLLVYIRRRLGVHVLPVRSAARDA